MLIAGNWKMNGTLAEATALSKAVVEGASHLQGQEVEILLCPPFTALTEVGKLLRGSPILLGAQDVYWEPKGPFTGEVSPALLADAGCRCCIVGHSERRHTMGETDAAVAKKLSALLSQGLRAILCVGEKPEERKQRETGRVIERQLGSALAGADAQKASQQVVIAYEPVWAIGTGKNATPDQAQEVHRLIRSWISKQWGPGAASSLSILYGGSVKPDNAASLLAQPDVDGALVGGASLDAQSFLSIAQAATTSRLRNTA